MNAKERVRTAMTKGIPDRVPVLPQICPPHAVRAAGLPYKETIVDMLQSPRKYDLLEADCASGYAVDGVRAWLGAPKITIEWEGEDAFVLDAETGERSGVVDFLGGGGPLPLKAKHRQLLDDDIEKIQIVSAEKLGQSEALLPAKKVIAKYGNDMFIVGVPQPFTIEGMFFTQGMETSLMDIVDRPDFVKRLTGRSLEASIQQAIALAQAGVDAIYIGDTFGQFMSPQQFADLCLPYFQRFVEQVRPHGPLIYLHMCGQVIHLLELMVETGVDCVEPLDEVAGTRVAEVKTRIGDHVALMGGVNTVLLSRGSLQEVKDDCARCIREGAEDGGYILAACDMLPTETSAEKVRAMVECANALGRYDT